MRTSLSFVASIGLAATVANGAIVAHTSHGDASLAGLEHPIAVGDLLSGLIASEQPGDLGWHPANTSPGDHLPAFTDDQGPNARPLYGLLNDACVAGCLPDYDDPVKLARYTFESPKIITELRIFTGNLNNADGRIFSTTLIKYSTDGGATFQDFGYFQSDPSGTLNNTSVGNYHSTLVWIFDDLGAPLLQNVTHIEFDFYAVHRNNDSIHDPFNGVNPFTGTDDGLFSPFTSPLVWEIDVLGFPSEICDNHLDDDGDERVDCDDPDCVGTLACFCHRPFADADGDSDVDQADFGAWQACFTGFSLGQVPQPPSYCYCFDRLKDNDIDLDDMVPFLNCLSGPNVPASLNCSN